VEKQGLEKKTKLVQQKVLSETKKLQLLTKNHVKTYVNDVITPKNGG
jgi:hypothetical protein